MLTLPCFLPSSFKSENWNIRLTGSLSPPSVALTTGGFIHEVDDQWALWPLRSLTFSTAFSCNRESHLRGQTVQLRPSYHLTCFPVRSGILLSPAIRSVLLSSGVFFVLSFQHQPFSRGDPLSHLDFPWFSTSLTRQIPICQFLWHPEPEMFFPTPLEAQLKRYNLERTFSYSPGGCNCCCIWATTVYRLYF